MSATVTTQDGTKNAESPAFTTKPDKRFVKLEFLNKREIILASQLQQHTTVFQPLLDVFKKDDSGIVTMPIDFEPEHFEHVLRYIRSGLYPIFYNDVSGHDVPRYLIVKTCAQQYGVKKLVDWITNKKYEAVVEKQYTTRWIQQKQHMIAPLKIVPSDETLTFFPISHIEQVYTCPRGIPVHRGDYSKCGQACSKAENRDYEDKFEDEFAGLVFMVHCKTVWRTELMEEDRTEAK